MDRHIYDRNLMEMAASLEDRDRRKFINIVQCETQNPVELFGWNAWLGWLGIDRFVVGDIGLPLAASVFGKLLIAFSSAIGRAPKTGKRFSIFMTS